MNENYKWNGATFNSKGIIIEKTPLSPTPKHSFNQYTIPGRNGFLTIDNETYDSIPLTLECHLNSSNVDMNEIRSWLDGYGELQIDNEKVYTGFISNSISFEKIVNFRKFIIQFTLQPIAKAIEKTTVNALSLETLVADTYVKTYPKITITGTGNITLSINDIPFTIYDADGEYELDCEAKIITKDGTNQSMNMSGEFPYIINGNNSIEKTGTITALTVEYYKAFI